MTAQTPSIPTRALPSEPLGFVLRLLLLVIGAGLSLSAFGLWLVPGSTVEPELTLIKLGLSLFMLIGGLCCLTGGWGRRV